MYTKEGFNHLLGGLEVPTKGYNPDDEGEWMMVRRVSQGSMVPFLPGDFHDKSCTAGDLEVEPLQRHHLPGLVLLLCCTESCQGKLTMVGIEPGSRPRGALLKLLDAADQIKCFVAIHIKSRRPYGIKVVLDGNENLFAVTEAAKEKLNSC